MCTIITTIILLTGCNSSTAKCYKNKRTVVKSYQMGKMIDTHFELKKGNYFRYFRKVIGLVKSEVYTGSYTVVNDTIVLNFCNNNIPDKLTGKGIFDKSGKSITLFTYAVNENDFIILKDKR